MATPAVAASAGIITQYLKEGHYHNRIILIITLHSY